MDSFQLSPFSSEVLCQVLYQVVLIYMLMPFLCHNFSFKMLHENKEIPFFFSFFFTFTWDSTCKQRNTLHFEPKKMPKQKKNLYNKKSNLQFCIKIKILKVIYNVLEVDWKLYTSDITLKFLLYHIKLPTFIKQF